MSDLLIHTHPLILALIIAAMMFGGWAFGCWRTRRLQQNADNNAVSQFSNASVALLGLLLAFTFSMSLERYEARRQMVVRHANTIGDFSTCVSMLNEPVRNQLKGEISRYVDHFILSRRSRFSEAELGEFLSTNDQMHARMQSLVKQAVDDGTPVTISLVNTFNNLISNHEERLAAVRNHLPPSIVILLCLSAVVATIQIGMQHGKLDERELVTGISFVVLVSLCIWITLDLNQPLSGVITVSNEPMLRLQAGLNQ